MRQVLTLTLAHHESFRRIGMQLYPTISNYTRLMKIDVSYYYRTVLNGRIANNFTCHDAVTGLVLELIWPSETSRARLPSRQISPKLTAAKITATDMRVKKYSMPKYAESLPSCFLCLFWTIFVPGIASRALRDAEKENRRHEFQTECEVRCEMSVDQDRETNTFRLRTFCCA